MKPNWQLCYNSSFGKLRVTLFNLLIMAFIAIGPSALVSCKKQQAVTQIPSAEEQKIEQAKRELRALLADNSKSIEQKERELAAIKAMNLNDPEVQSLIAELEAKLAAEKARLAEEERRRKEEEERKSRSVKSPQEQLSQYFNQIAGSQDLNLANQGISQALGMFSSPEAPVLIIISEAGGMVDYDRPTTIKKYLEYLKDQKKQAEKIKNIVYDNNGKIKELELTKL